MTREHLKGGHFLGGVECEPAPRGFVQFLGVVAVGLVVAVLPEFLFVRFARALARGCGGSR